jgi:hypothetical protein
MRVGSDKRVRWKGDFDEGGSASEGGVDDGAMRKPSRLAGYRVYWTHQAHHTGRSAWRADLRTCSHRSVGLPVLCFTRALTQYRRWSQQPRRMSHRARTEASGRRATPARLGMHRMLSEMDGTHSSRGSSWTASVPRASVEASGQSADAVCSRSRFNKYCSCASSACTPSRPHARRLAGAALHVFARVTSCACMRAWPGARNAALKHWKGRSEIGWRMRSGHA